MKMSVNTLRKTVGDLNILKICNYNLKSVKDYIIRECGLPKGYDLTYTMKIFKKILSQGAKTTVKKKRWKEITLKMKQWRNNG